MALTRIFFFSPWRTIFHNLLAFALEICSAATQTNPDRTTSLGCRTEVKGVGSEKTAVDGPDGYLLFSWLVGWSVGEVDQDCRVVRE